MSEIFKIQLRRETESGTIIRTIIVDQSFFVTNVDTVYDLAMGAWKLVGYDPIPFDTAEHAIENAKEQVREFLSRGFDFFPTTEDLRIANTDKPQFVQDEIQRRNGLTFGPEQLQKQLNCYLRPAPALFRNRATPASY